MRPVRRQVWERFEYLSNEWLGFLASDVQNAKEVDEAKVEMRRGINKEDNMGDVKKKQQSSSDYLLHVRPHLQEPLKNKSSFC